MNKKTTPVGNKSTDQISSNGNGNGSGTKPEPVQDIFTDLSKLRISQDFITGLGVKKHLLTIPVKKPAREWFVRTNPDLRITTGVIELKEEREIYVISPILCPILASMEATFGPRILQGSINRQGDFFFWPIRLPDSSSRSRTDGWNRSAIEAAAMAENPWVRVSANMSLGAYELTEAMAPIPDPEWPEQDLSTLLRIAFKDHVIDDLEHPVLKNLRGEI